MNTLQEHEILRFNLLLAEAQMATRAGVVSGEFKRLKEELESFERDPRTGDGKIDWRAAFATKPVKATEMADLIDREIPYIIKPLIARGSLTQLQGIQKGGKSAFSLYLALCASTGAWPQPQYLVADAPLKVLYIAWEDPAIMMAKRLSLYAVGLGFDRKFLPENLTFLYGPDIFIEREDHTKALEAAIAELKPDIVFVDTLSQVHLADENSASEMKVPMRNLYKVARDSNVGLVYLHHTGKGSAEKIAQDKSRGSGAIAAAWHILIDWGVRDKGSNVNPVEVQSKYEHEWKNWAISYNPQKDEFGNAESVGWEIGSDLDFAPGKSVVDKKRARIQAVFAQFAVTGKEWVTSQEVTEVSNLGLDERSIRRHILKMCEDQEVESRYTSKREPIHYRLRVGGGK